VKNFHPTHLQGKSPGNEVGMLKCANVILERSLRANEYRIGVNESKLAVIIDVTLRTFAREKSDLPRENLPEVTRGKFIPGFIFPR